jgi:serine/threonine protein kinase
MAASDAPLPRIGNYTILDQLGEGSFAKVFLAVHDVIHISVAIKQISKSQFTGQRDLLRIRREIRILKTVVHQYVIELFEILEDEKYLYLVMEHAQHGSLAQLLRSGNPLPEAECSRIFRQVTIGLGYLHTQLNLIHRDVKAENILLDEQDNVRLIDFGLSNVFRPGARQTYCGSPNYAAPEIIMKGPYTKTADIWSLGILLYFMATGQLPFAGQALSKLVHCLVDETIPSPPTVPPGLADLLANLLHRDPARRIAIEDILEHPWLSDGHFDLQENKLARFESLVDDLTVDDAIIAELQQLGLDTTELAPLMEKGEFNEVTALYRIKRRMREMQRLACRPSRLPVARGRPGGKLMGEQSEGHGTARPPPWAPLRKRTSLLIPVRRSILAPNQRRIPTRQFLLVQKAAALGDGQG